MVDLCSSAVGTYTITNTIAASGGCAAVIATTSLTINPIANGTFSYAGITFCSGGSNPSPTFSGGGVGGIFTSTGGIVLDSITGVVDLTLSTAGTYIVTNLPASIGGCTAVSDTAIIIIAPVPIATFSYIGSPYCQNASNPLPTFSGGGVAGVFSSSVGIVIDSITGLVDLVNSLPGTYTVTNTIAANGACSGASFSSTITIISSPIANFSYIGTPYCVGSSNPSPTFSGGGIAGHFTSTPGLVLDSITGIVDVASSIPGTYTVTNTVSVAGCSPVVFTSVINISPVTANAGVDLTFICGTPTVTLDGSLSSSGVNIVYLWTTANGQIVSGATTTAPIADSAGTYIITVTDTAGNCSASDTVVVSGAPGPLASFTANPTAGSPPLTVNFTNTSIGGNSFIWTFGTGDSSLVNSPNYIYTNSGTYSVVLTVHDTAGCNDTASFSIFVYDSYSLVVGNVFTPNDDGFNDLFMINCSGVQTIEGDIYDRWGVKVFTFHAPKEGWDGRTITGQNALPGTYYYIVKTIDFEGKEHEDKGFFVLIR